ncbi:MAG: HDIG domain-containing protein, partial [Bdellovibrionales bacterium]|nr:HDIG domain-containing protein [Bdellovibrionales bacterium]
CGVDLIFDEKNMTLSVSGFDPVRRELARASMEKMMHDKDLNPQRIESLIEKTKKDLFKKIRKSGETFAKELHLENMSPEIKNTMGALMYRYSFSQNQYFHCTEVGYLCGMLSSELGLSLKDGRRAGGLHDIGKSMDHSIDGGHAVIGADFIEKHGEAEHIVHAVRAHHFDETPSTELAYLVIAADAISGARPGARRSTANTYMQKMEDLEVAASSFQEVIDTLILSAGREVRVHVDGEKVKDLEAMHLSKKIAQKIERDCSYPGTIKVTVVRKTQAVEYAK